MISRITQRVIIFLVALLWAHLISKPHQPFLINDSAVEILQVRDMPAWPPMALIDTYEGGGVDYIESAVPYIYKAAITTFGDSIEVYAWTMHVIFALSTLLFFIFLIRRFPPSTAWVSTLLFMVSAYSLYPTLILTRNGASALLCLFWILSAEDAIDKNTPWHHIKLGVATLICLLCYSSFKIFITAGFLIILTQSLIRKDRRLTLNLSMVAGSVCMILATLLEINDQSIVYFITRGSYVSLGFDSNQTIFNRTINFAWRTLTLPLHESPQGFMAESMHRIFNRGMLAYTLRPLFVAGLAILLLHKKTFAIKNLNLWISLWLLCALGMSYGGPSLKSNFVFWVPIFLIVTVGLNFINEYTRPLNRSTYIIFSCLLIASTSLLEARYIKTDITKNIYYNPESQGYLLSKLLNSRKFDMAIYHVCGVDNSRIYLPDFKTKTIYTWDADNFRKNFLEYKNTGIIIFAAPDDGNFWKEDRANGELLKSEKVQFNNATYRIETYNYKIRTP